jgi:hypothetical protein
LKTAPAKARQAFSPQFPQLDFSRSLKISNAVFGRLIAAPSHRLPLRSNPLSRNQLQRMNYLLHEIDFFMNGGPRMWRILSCDGQGGPGFFLSQVPEHPHPRHPPASSLDAPVLNFR